MYQNSRPIIAKTWTVQYTGPFRNPKKKKYISKETSYYFLYFQVIDIILFSRQQDAAKIM